MRKTLERVRLFSGEVPPPFARYLIIILYVTTKQTANPMVFEYYSPLLQHDILYPAHFIPFPYQYKLVLDRAPSFRSVRDTWWYTGKSNLVEFKFGQIWSNSNLVKFGRIQIWSNLVEFKFGRIWSNSNLVEFVQYRTQTVLFPWDCILVLISTATGTVSNVLGTVYHAIIEYYSRTLSQDCQSTKYKFYNIIIR